MATKVLLVGGGAREHAMARALAESGAELFTVMKNKNPGIMKLSKDVSLSSETDKEKVALYAKLKGVEIAVVGPEAPLEAGVSDALEKEGIRCAAPSQAAARIETSKEFMRHLMTKHRLPGGVEHHVFTDPKEAKAFLAGYGKGVAVKPVGLTGGKGVKLSGEQLLSREDAIAYATEVLDHKIGGSAKVIIEEKLEGEEYTLQCFSDGRKVVPMPAVQDHKRAYEGDKGPNTGGMGSYSQEDHLLPFLKSDEYSEGARIVQQVIDALAVEGCPYHGPIYGQFMLTGEGPKVIEFNARFGDPEAMNVLSLLEGGYVGICGAIVDGSLTNAKASFAHKATVCKYVVPVGYGTESRAGSPLTVDEKAVEAAGARLYYAAVNQKDEHTVLTTTSRAIGVVGMASGISGAETLCEEALGHIKGDYAVRHDIGKPEALKRKVEHMRKVRGGG